MVQVSQQNATSEFVCLRLFWVWNGRRLRYVFVFAEKSIIFCGSPIEFLCNPPTAITGPPSEEDCIADIDAAYAYLRKTLNVPAQNIVLYGRSLGSGPSCQLAAKTALLSKDDAEYASEDGPVGGLILHAPFLSVFRVVLDTGCTLPGDKFPNVDIVPMVKTPVLLIHGTGDQIVSFSHSERLFKAIPTKYRTRPLYIDGMGHNNVHSQVRPMFVDRLLEYLENHVWPMAVSQQPLPLSKTKKRGWKVEPEYEDEVATNRALSQPRIPS
jgi:abhydrolase domain-containing protein 17